MRAGGGVRRVGSLRCSIRSAPRARSARVACRLSRLAGLCEFRRHCRARWRVSVALRWRRVGRPTLTDATWFFCRRARARVSVRDGMANDARVCVRACVCVRAPACLLVRAATSPTTTCAREAIAMPAAEKLPTRAIAARSHTARRIVGPRDQVSVANCAGRHRFDGLPPVRRRQCEWPVGARRRRAAHAALRSVRRAPAPL